MKNAVIEADVRARPLLRDAVDGTLIGRSVCGFTLVGSPAGNVCVSLSRDLDASGFKAQADSKRCEVRQTLESCTTAVYALRSFQQR